MLAAQSFFDLSSWEHTGLIKPEEQVWLALRNLAAYLQEQLYPELAPTLIRDSEPLQRNLVLG